MHSVTIRLQSVTAIISDEQNWIIGWTADQSIDRRTNEPNFSRFWPPILRCYSMLQPANVAASMSQHQEAPNNQPGTMQTLPTLKMWQISLYVNHPCYTHSHLDKALLQREIHPHCVFAENSESLNSLNSTVWAFGVPCAYPFWKFGNSELTEPLSGSKTKKWLTDCYKQYAKATFSRLSDAARRQTRRWPVFLLDFRSLRVLAASR